MRFSSWNVNGIRSILKKAKDGEKMQEGDISAISSLILEKKIDVLCLQEVRTHDPENIKVAEYSKIFTSLSKGKKGYSGVAILTNLNVINFYENFDLFEEMKEYSPSLSAKGEDSPTLASVEEKHSPPSLSVNTFPALNEGRLLTLELDEYFVVNVYTPNSKEHLSRKEEREEWDYYFLIYCELLISLSHQKNKTLVICGDFNVAHNEIDIYSPKTHQNVAGFADYERHDFTLILEIGLIDTFREKHPKLKRFSYFSNRGRARENGSGWRLDYFLVDANTEFKKSEILDSFYGSDHLPLLLEL